ncbi:MAG: beta-N-acetylhexosaminidase [Pseudomonadota bacterium]
MPEQQRVPHTVASMMRGPLLVDIEGFELTPDDCEFLRHPAVGGVVLFARNYRDPGQLAALTRALHALTEPPLIVSVDQEGGRVQRFGTGFTTVPSMGRVGGIASLSEAEEYATAAGLVLGAELHNVGVDLNFAPVLDVDQGVNAVIGARSFGSDPDRVQSLALALAAGLNAAGLPAVGKHFPGHGAVTADSHLELPVDHRSSDDLHGCDLIPFAAWSRCAAGALMTAHIQIPAVAPEPATFSAFWLQQVLRNELGFDGLIFSDDLGMAAARLFGSCDVAAAQALEAGCDVVLVCNDRVAATTTAEALERSGAYRKQIPALAARSTRLWSSPKTAAPMTLSAARARLLRLAE